MIRAKYRRPDGSEVSVVNRVRTCVDHRASVEHSRMHQAGLKLVSCEQIDDSGRVEITRQLPPESLVLPEQATVPPRGISVSSLKNRGIR